MSVREYVVKRRFIVSCIALVEMKGQLIDTVKLIQ